MKTKNILLALPLLLVACSGQETNSEPASQEASSLLEISTEPILTRVAVDGSSFLANDTIAVALISGPEDAAAALLSAKRYAYNGSTWNAVDGGSKLNNETKRVVAGYPASIINNNLMVDVRPNASGNQQEYLYGYSTNTVDAYNTRALLKFQFALPCIQFNIYWNDADMAQEHPSYTLDSLTLSGSALYTQGVFNIMTGGVQGTSVSSIALPVTGNKTLRDGMSSPITKKFLAIPTEGTNFNLTLLINGKNTTATIPAVNWQAGKRYIYNVRLKGPNPDDIQVFISDASIDPRVNTTSAGLEGTGPEPDTVSVGGIKGSPIDLGLSVKWADHNMGAFMPHQLGGLYYWGDPTGKADNSPLTTLNRTKSIAKTTDDIATQQWGKGWHLPTADDFYELVTSCQYEIKTEAGVTGARFYSTATGGSIFLPFTGFISNGNALRTDEGFYWGANGFYFDRIDSENVEAAVLRLRSTEAVYNAVLPVNLRRCSVRPVK